MAVTRAPTEVPATVGPGPGAAHTPRWARVAVVAMTSASVILTEIAYTRVVSFKIFYYYVFLVIGLALLGLGAGGVAVSVSRRLGRAHTDSVLIGGLLAGAVCTAVSYVASAPVHIDTLSVWRYGTAASFGVFGLILLLCVCVFSAFVGPGIVLATVFSRQAHEVGRLYAADLAGAGIASAVVIFLIATLGAPACAMVAAALLAAAALLVTVLRSGVGSGAKHLPAGRRGVRKSMRVRGTPSWSLPVAVVALAGSAVLAAQPGLLPTQAVDSSKYFVKPHDPDVYSAWGPVFRVDVAPAPHHPSVMNLYHDGILGAAILKWDGTRDGLSVYDFPHDARSLAFTVLHQPPAREVIIGAAGGHEVLTSLFYGARHVDAVELNPVTVGLVRTTFAGFDGHVAQDPRVDYITGDGRSYLARSPVHDQLIWYPAPDSYAASNSALASAYVLSESYLYTTDALVSVLNHLTSRGIFVAQFGEDDNVHDLRTTRFVATARAALAALGVREPASHIMVAETVTKFLGIPLSTILIGKGAFTPAQVSRFVAAATTVPGTQLLAAPGHTAPPGPVESIATLPSGRLGEFFASFPFDVTPTTDNQPYFWHFARYGSVMADMLHRLSSLNREDSVGERVLILLLIVSVLVAALFLLVPLFAIRREWRSMPAKSWSALFFAGIGFGFMFFEITLMQILNLFLGYPTYALTVTLTSLLVFTGVGALVSQRFITRTSTSLIASGTAQARVPLPPALVVLGVFLVFYLFGLPHLADAALGAPFALRVMITVACLAPAGACMGTFLPLGLTRLSALGGGRGDRAYVAWGWATNGFASVVGSVLATIFSMAFGFRTVLGLGFALYLVATVAWRMLGRVAPPAPPSGALQA